MKIFSSDGTAADRCIQMITDICAVAEVGKTYLGKVVRIVDFGAFVEIFPGTDGLLHISEIAENRIKQVRDELNEGDQILVSSVGAHHDGVLDHLFKACSRVFSQSSESSVIFPPTIVCRLAPMVPKMDRERTTIPRTSPKLWVMR